MRKLDLEVLGDDEKKEPIKTFDYEITYQGLSPQNGSMMYAIIPKDRRFKPAKIYAYEHEVSYVPSVIGLIKSRIREVYNLGDDWVL